MKQNHMKLAFCKADILAIAMVVVTAILVSIIFWTSIGSEEGGLVSVYQEGELILELPLENDAEFVVAGEYENVVVVKNGLVYTGSSALGIFLKSTRCIRVVGHVAKTLLHKSLGHPRLSFAVCH